MRWLQGLPGQSNELQMASLFLFPLHSPLVTSLVSVRLHLSPLFSQIPSAQVDHAQAGAALKEQDRPI